VLDIKEEISLCFTDWQKALTTDWNKLLEIIINNGVNCREHWLIHNLNLWLGMKPCLNQGETNSVDTKRGKEKDVPSRLNYWSYMQNINEWSNMFRQRFQD